MQLHPRNRAALEIRREGLAVGIERNPHHRKPLWPETLAEFTDAGDVDLAGLTPACPVVDQHRRALEAREAERAAVDRRAGEGQGLPHALQPSCRSASLAGCSCLGKRFGDLTVAVDRCLLIARKLLGNPDLEHGFGSIRRLGIRSHKGVEVGKPGILHSLEIRTLSEHAGGVAGRCQAKRHKSPQVRIGSHALGELLKPLNPIGDCPLLNRRRNRFGELPNPEVAIFGRGRGHDLLKHLQLLGDQRRPLGRPGLHQAIFGGAKGLEQRLEGIAHLRTGGLGGRHPRREEGQRLADFPTLARQLRQIDRTPGLAAPHQRPDKHLPRAFAGFKERHNIVVGHHIGQQGLAVGSDHPREGGEHVVPPSVAGHPLLAGGQIGKPLGGRRGAGREGFQPLAPEPSSLQFLTGGQQPGEATHIACGESSDDFCGGFFGRNGLPAVDRAIFVVVDAPAAAGLSQPAGLVGLGVVVGVDVAIDLDAIFVVAPAIHHPVVVGVGKRPQNAAIVGPHHPGGAASTLFHRDGRLGRLSRRQPVVGDAGLKRLKPQRVVDGRRGRCQRCREGEGGREPYQMPAYPPQKYSTTRNSHDESLPGIVDGTLVDGTLTVVPRRALPPPQRKQMCRNSTLEGLQAPAPKPAVAPRRQARPIDFRKRAPRLMTRGRRPAGAISARSSVG